jgi:hypothetical protein
MRPRLPSSLSLLLLILVLLGILGCGYIGEPLPPLLNIPARVADLAAVQRGSNLLVNLTLPTMTTEGVLLKQDVRLDLRAGPKPAGAFQADAWAASARSAGQGVIENGRASYRIPASEWIGKDVAVAVKVVGANGRDAGWSNPVTLTVVPPPEQPAGLTAEAVPGGVHLTWRGAGNDFAIFREGPDEKTFTLLAHSDKPEATDATVQFGKPYLYVVQSFAKAGQGKAESELSNEVQIVPADTFPPAVPAGLTAVPSTASIELVWERNTEPDLAGYRVYRALGGGPFERLADSQELPSYSDRKIESGKVYRYAVSAVKRNGVESKMSAPVEVTAP